MNQIQNAPGALSRPGFLMGTKSLFDGMWWLVTHPRAWPLAMVPMLVGSALSVAFGIGVIKWLPRKIGQAIGPTHSTWATIGMGTVEVGATILAVVLAVVVAFALAQPLSGPALEALVRKKEADMGLPVRPPTSFIADILRSLQSMLIGYAFGLPVIALLLVVSLLVPGAGFVLFPLKLVVAAFTVSWDLCDYPLSIRGMAVSERMRIIAAHKRAVLGFSVGLALAGMVPGLLFLLLPGGVIGATTLTSEIEAYERQA